MSSSSSYSSPSTSFVGLQTQSSIKPINHQSVHHPLSTHPIPPSHRYSRATSNEPTFRRKLGLPYSSHPQRRLSNHPSSSPSRSLITVLPPESLPSHPSQLRPNASSANGPSSAPRLRNGILIPLYPTLASQLAAISREYGLPSSGGMVLYLLEGSSRSGELANQLVGGPRISEEAWQILWSGVFEDEREEAFQNNLRAKDLYDLELDPQLSPINHRVSPLGFNQSVEEEEVLNGGLEELINSGLNFPNPPPNCGSTHAAHFSHSFQEDSPNSSATLSTEPSPMSSHSSGRSHDFEKLNSHSTQHDSPVLARMAHARSMSSSSHKPNSIQSVRLLSADLPPRPSTSFSTQPPCHLSSRRTDLSSLSNHYVASDRSSLYSLAMRPRRIGAGTIVGRIEFDIDRSRSCGRWYDLWLNPPSLSRHHPSISNLVSDDHARPLLLPNLITQRNKSSTSLSDSQRQIPISPNVTGSSRLTNSNDTTPSGNKSRSFLAFDDNINHTDNLPGYISAISGGIFYSNQDNFSKEETSCDLPTSQLKPVKKSSNSLSAQIGEKRQFGSRIVNEQHRQAMAMVAAQAKHQALVDQIDAQLSSPIVSDFPRNHCYGLSLGVDSHLELADVRYTQHEDQFESSSVSYSAIGMTTNALATNPSSKFELLNSQCHVKSDPALDKRTSSMAMKSNLDELEQVLASLSPKALRLSPASSPPNLPSAPLSAISMESANPTHSRHARTSSSSYSRHTANGSSGNQSQRSFDVSLDEKGEVRLSKRFENRQESFIDLKQGSSHEDVPVGLTEGYTREDVREYKAPFSPLVTKRSFSPAFKNIIRPNTPSTKKSGDGFVSKAAGIVTSKFRSSASR